MISSQQPPRVRCAAPLLGLGLVAFFGLMASACRTEPEREPVVVLISLDGFRADYLEKLQPPNLTSLARSGVVAEALISSFPTKTFPNHYTIVTGLYPAHHGITSNNIYDPDLDARFGLSRREEVQRSDWWLGEPIWITAEKNGIKAAPLFWPGSEAEIKGLRPSHWLPYDDDMTADARLELFFQWIDLPAEERPRFYTMYFSDTDSQGHRHGPDSDQLRDAVARVDGHIGDMIGGLAERNQPADLIVVSDHGMAPTSPERVILIDDLIDLSERGELDVVDLDPVAMIRVLTEDDDEQRGEPRGTTAARVIEALSQHPHLRAYHRDDLPSELHYSGSARIPEVIAIADEGWRITRRERFEDNPEAFRGGAHGYPPSDRSMDALFVANGPSFESGLTVPAFENIHLYELLAHLLGVEAADNDGDPAVTKRFLVGVN